MALERKPRVGETLLDGNGKRYVVTHFLATNDSVCCVTDERGGNNSFIWKHGDGTLNTWLKHEG